MGWRPAQRKPEDEVASKTAVSRSLVWTQWSATSRAQGHRELVRPNSPARRQEGKPGCRGTLQVVARGKENCARRTTASRSWSLSCNMHIWLDVSEGNPVRRRVERCAGPGAPQNYDRPWSEQTQDLCLFVLFWGDGSRVARSRVQAFALGDRVRCSDGGPPAGEAKVVHDPRLAYIRGARLNTNEPHEHGEEYISMYVHGNVSVAAGPMS